MSLNAAECNHTSPDQLAKMAEAFFLKQGLSEQDWDGCVFGFGENVISPIYKSVYIEIARRGENWMATKIDRRKEEIIEADRGFVIRNLGEAAQKNIAV